MVVTFQKRESAASPSDRELMERLAAGDVTPLERLYLRWGSMVEGAVHRFAPEISQGEAQDLVQEVFLALKELAPRYREQDRLRSWIYAVAVRKTKTWRKTTWLRRKLLESSAGRGVALGWRFDDSPEHMADVRRRVADALSSLPRSLREVVILHELEGFTGEEIARILEIRPQAVWTRLHRARRKMAAACSEEADESTGGAR